MKRILYLLAGIAAVVCLASCGDDSKGTSATYASPTLTWTGNEKFSQTEILENFSANIQIAAEGGIESLKVTVECSNIMCYTNVNHKISIKSNLYPTSSKPVLDIVNDSASAALFGLSDVSGKKSVSLNLAAIVNSAVSGVVLSDGDKISCAIEVKDPEGQAARKTAVFHWTAEPTIEWTDVSSTGDAQVWTSADDAPAEFVITAPATIKDFTIQVSSANKEFRSYLEVYINDAANKTNFILDLINDTKTVKMNLGTGLGKDLQTNKKVTLSLESLLDYLSGVAADGEVDSFVFSVTDEYGRSTKLVAKYKYSAS